MLAIIAALTQLLALVPQGTALYNTLVANRAKAQEWADTGYVPTAADWDALNTQIKADEAKIDANAAG